MSAAEGERAGLPLVAVRVYAACLGWGMLTGAVLGAAYLAMSLARDNKWDGSAGVAMVIGGAYGAPLGLVSGAVLGLGAAAGAVVGAPAEWGNGVRDAASGSLDRAVWYARLGFLLTAGVVLLLWRFVFGGQSDNWFEWTLVTVVVTALVMGTWRAGRATRRALTPRAGVPG